MTAAAIRDVLKDDPSIFTEEQIEYIGQNVVEAARKVCGERLRGVILYGSYARGDFRDWSDVDFMVLADIGYMHDPEERGLSRKISDELFDLDNEMNLLLSVIVTPYSRFVDYIDDYPFYRNVNREGKRLCQMSAT